MSEDKVYGIADKAWQVVVGCDPHMKCAPRCWARKSVARVVECQAGQCPDRAAFFQIALSADGQQWSGAVFPDPVHLADPLSWYKPGLVATGFHGDIGRLPHSELDRVFAVIALCRMFQAVYPSKFMLLTKQPASLLEYLDSDEAELAQQWGIAAGDMLDGDWIWNKGKRHRERIDAFISAGHGFYPDDESLLGEDAFPIPLDNVTIGCSVMDQSDADAMREPMQKLAALGWKTHVWYEPAVGPVNWKGWEFLELVIAGGESGQDARPAKPEWFRTTRDWCLENGVAFRFKQWGEYAPVAKYAGADVLARVGKKAAGNLLDGVSHDGVPRFK